VEIMSKLGEREWCIARLGPWIAGQKEDDRQKTLSQHAEKRMTST